MLFVQGCLIAKAPSHHKHKTEGSVSWCQEANMKMKKAYDVLEKVVSVRFNGSC